MSEVGDAAELLFFDTFSHEETDINLDLVQFPKPVILYQVRIIPLGARVQADFPGGVRLGATNPSKFDVEFYVNDLGMPGASTFEHLGHLQYNQNDCIHLECSQEKILTDGLVLRGLYNTITLAVYGVLTNSAINNDPIASPPPSISNERTTEEICVTTGIQDVDVPKEEWKEPLAGEVAAHAHKTNVSDYERDDLDYSHYQGDERERRLRKTSHSSERSASSRNRTLSDSNERDYIRNSSSRYGDSRSDREREKSTRDWSRSPDYTRRSRRKRSDRSRSDVDELQKWPRTPPASIDSPTRPRSPDNMDFIDDETAAGSTQYKHKTHGFMRSCESLENMSGQESHNLDDAPDTPGEQFEPILSDDEIADDDSNIIAQEMVVEELELDDDTDGLTIAESAINDFDPFKMNVPRYEMDLCVAYAKDLKNLEDLINNFKIQTKCFAGVETFKNCAITSKEEQENFVYLSEQLINQLAYISQHYKQYQFVLRTFFGKDRVHLSQVFLILKIGLDFEAACLQPQPAFKIRHIKIGARLMELLGSCEEFVKYILDNEHFEPFDAIFKLYRQEFMALSIRQMLLKSVYALLDTKSGVRHFISSKLNGYQMILETIQNSHLTLSKFALQAIIKKLNLHEALESIRECCTKLFVLTNYYTESGVPDDVYQTMESAISLLLDALTINTLSYQQPKRFLPVSIKFEIITDLYAHRSFTNTLRSYFKQNILGESLLLLFSNSKNIPQKLLLRSAQLLKALLQTYVGVNYFVDDCFDTTQILIATLLGNDDVPSEEEPAKVDKSAEEVTEVGLKTSVENAQNDDSVKLKTLLEIDEKLPEPATVFNVEKSEDSTQLMDENAKDTKASTTKPSTNINDSEKLNTKTTEILPKHNSELTYLQRLGIELAYKVKTHYHLDVINFHAASIEYDSIELATQLHDLYSQTCSPIGRQHTVEFLGLNNNMKVFMEIIKKEQRHQVQRNLASPGNKYKSPVLSYAVDIVDCCVRYCENLNYFIESGVNILELAKNHETFEPSVSAVLQEMYAYLRPLEVVNLFTHDDVTPLVEIISRSLEYITTFPGDLIMALRILRYLLIGPAGQVTLKSSETIELKHRLVLLQFYAIDGFQTLTQVIEKLCQYFEQPGLHGPVLGTIQGIQCCQIIVPTLEVLHEILSYAIQCRDVDFKDITGIDHLMKAYYLLHAFPERCQAAEVAKNGKEVIIRILLAYTQPNEQNEETLHKSLWTLMIREVLKNIDAPATFIPGLQVLSKLLPLPLPLPITSAFDLTDNQLQRLIRERKLWSAHLHPQSSQIAKLIEMIVPTTFPALTDMLLRVCAQLADLAPNMTLLISKTITDLICTEWSSGTDAPTAHLAQLIQFFARLTTNASIKSSTMSILGKLWEALQAILKISEPNEIGRKCQINILRILESFLDCRISLVSSKSLAPPDLNLASALPPKEYIPRITEALLNCLLNVNNIELAVLCLRNLILLTEHDITFYHLTQLLKHRSNEFQNFIRKIVETNDCQSLTVGETLESLLLLLRSLTQFEKNPKVCVITNIPLRTLKLSWTELFTMTVLRNAPTDLIEKFVTFVERNDYSSESLIDYVQELQTQLRGIGNLPTTDNEESETATVEPHLPQSESIVTQYAVRPLVVLNQSKIDEKTLTEGYWLDNIRWDIEESDKQTNGLISCDLIQLVEGYIPGDSNLSNECKRVLHLSASPQSNRERTPTTPCFRTRRVEVEPSTGRPEKKIYITPVRGRGFTRGTPARGDLFRSRPPNTSRPPSLHVDDFLALETCGAQPTGPTGYNKIPSIMRGTRVGRSRGSRIAAAAAYRKAKILRTGSPSGAWQDGNSPHYRPSPDHHFVGEPHYAHSGHFIGRQRRRGGRPYMR